MAKCECVSLCGFFFVCVHVNLCLLKYKVFADCVCVTFYVFIYF